MHESGELIMMVKILMCYPAVGGGGGAVFLLLLVGYTGGSVHIGWLG